MVLTGPEVQPSQLSRQIACGLLMSVKCQRPDSFQLQDPTRRTDPADLILEDSAKSPFLGVLLS